VEVAARALEAARSREHVVVWAHPDDLDALRAAGPDLAAALVRSRGIAWRGDAEVARGGVRVETEAGVIDATLEAQLEGLRRAVSDGAAAGQP